MIKCPEWKKQIFDCWDGDNKCDDVPAAFEGTCLIDEAGLDKQAADIVCDMGIVFFYNPETGGVDKMVYTKDVPDLTDISSAIDVVIDCHQRIMCSRRMQSLKAAMPSNEFMRDCRTVRINMGRQIGHSTYIAQHANLNDIIIVNNTGELNFFKKTHSCKYDCPVVTIKEFLNNKHSVDTVWIDGSHVIGNCDDAFAFYKYVAVGVKRIIILG